MSVGMEVRVRVKVGMKVEIRSEGDTEGRMALIARQSRNTKCWLQLACMRWD